MKRHSHNESSDESDELWELLGQSRTPRVDPRFVGNVRQQVAAEPQDRRGFDWRLLLAPWRLAFAATAVLAFGAVLFLRPGPEPATPLAVNHLPDDQEAVRILETVAPAEKAVDPMSTPLEADDAALMVAMLPALLEMEEESEWAEAFDSVDRRDG